MSEFLESIWLPAVIKATAKARRFGAALDKNLDDLLKPDEELYREFMKHKAGSLQKFVESFDPSRSFPISFYRSMGLCLDREYWREGVSGALDFMDSHAIRGVFTDTLSFSIPATETLKEISIFADGDVIEEHFAGTGYWAYLLEKEFNQKVLAHDLNCDHYAVSNTKSFVPIITRNVTRAKPKANSTVMMSWIPYESAEADKFLRKMNKGQKLIHISEGEGGCCAADSTFKILDNEFECVKTSDMVVFHGLHDRMDFLRKL
jgi:hypothetical protein